MAIKRKNEEKGERVCKIGKGKAFAGMPAHLPSRIVRVQEDALVNRWIGRVLYHKRLA